MNKKYFLAILFLTITIAISFGTVIKNTKATHWSDQLPKETKDIVTHITDIGFAYRDTVFCKVSSEVTRTDSVPGIEFILPADTTIRLKSGQTIFLIYRMEFAAFMGSFDPQTKEANVDSILKMHFQTKFLDANGKVVMFDSLDKKLHYIIETLYCSNKVTGNIMFNTPLLNGGNYYWTSTNNVDRQVKNGHIRIEKPSTKEIISPMHLFYDTLLVTPKVCCGFPYDLNMKGTSVQYTLYDALGRKLAEKTINTLTPTDTAKMEYIQTDTAFHRLKTTSPYYYIVSKPSWKDRADTTVIEMTTIDKSYTYTGTGFNYSNKIFSTTVLEDRLDTTYHYNRDTIPFVRNKGIGYNYTFRIMRDADKTIDESNLDSISNIKVTCAAQDIYGNQLISDDISNSISDMVKVARTIGVEGGNSLSHSMILNRGGKYVFRRQSTLRPLQSDTLTFVCDPRLEVTTCDEKKEPSALYIGEKGHFRATIGSGFPYNPSDYQGKSVTFELQNESKQTIATKTITLNASNDSTLMEYYTDTLLFEPTITDNTYYIVISGSLGSKTIQYTAISDPTSIKVNANANANAIYNLQGVRVNDSYKGIIIRNKKKFFNK